MDQIVRQIFLANASCDECLEIFLLEVLNLKKQWNALASSEKGYRLGKIIGKHGLTVLLPIGVVKGVVKYQIFRRANTI